MLTLLRRKAWRGPCVGEDARGALAMVRGVSIKKAIEMIQDAIQSRIEGGPSGLRRAFRATLRPWDPGTAVC